MSLFRLFCFKTHILYLRFQELKSSRANQDITIRIDFKKIPVQRIEPQSSSRVINKMKIFPLKKKNYFYNLVLPQSKRWIILKLPNFLRVSHCDEVITA